MHFGMILILKTITKKVVWNESKKYNNVMVGDR